MFFFLIEISLDWQMVVGPNDWQQKRFQELCYLIINNCILQGLLSQNHQRFVSISCRRTYAWFGFSLWTCSNRSRTGSSGGWPGLGISSGGSVRPAQSASPGRCVLCCPWWSACSTTSSPRQTLEAFWWLPVLLPPQHVYPLSVWSYWRWTCHRTNSMTVRWIVKWAGFYYISKWRGLFVCLFSSK